MSIREIMTTIYLAGPIAGLTYEEVASWRIEVKKLLANLWPKHKRIIGDRPKIIDPFDLPGIREMVYHSGGVLPMNADTWVKEIFQYDVPEGVLASDGVLCGIPSTSTYSSFGTGFELGAFYTKNEWCGIQRPITIWTERVQPIHTFIDALDWPVFTSLETACKVLVRGLLKEEVESTWNKNPEKIGEKPA